jgi:signal transduction histidine kinase
MVIRNAGRPAGVVISVSGRPLDPSAGRRGAVAVFHDITARKEAERRLAKASERLKAELTLREATEAALRAREAELEAFAGIVAHDLKAPLTTVAGFAEVLRDCLDGRPGGPGAEEVLYLDRISGGVGRMRHLIDDLLTYATARDGAIGPVPVALQTVVADVVTERTAHLRTGQHPDGAPRQFPDIYTGPLPTVRADPALLRQLLDNLIGNALTYTMPRQPARIDISAHAEGDGWVRVDVADRGVGVPASDRDQVLTAFHRVRAPGSPGGTGLGLAICHRIVDRHGGAIAVTDNPGGGGPRPSRRRWSLRRPLRDW